MNRLKKITQHAELSEKAIERKLVAECRKHDLLCIKFSSSTDIGFPDRLIFADAGRATWAEIKSAGKKPRKTQLIRHEQLRALGFKVYVIDHTSQIEPLLEELI